jgi:uncharacterized phage infection (PIP) family protein YhgE
MRTNILIGLHSVLCVIGGGAIALAFSETSAASIIPWVLGGVVFIGGSLAWTLFSFRKVLSTFQNHLVSDRKTGLADFDEVKQSINDQVEAIETEAIEQTDELVETKKLLKVIDRRSSDYDRDGNPLTGPTRLRGILTGYGNYLGENVEQATSCGRELERAVKEIVSGSETQFDVFSKATNHLEELSGYLVEACDSAESTLQTSSDVRFKVETGLEQFQALAEQMKTIRKQAVARERKFQSLTQHTKEIESIVQTIGSLSSRTDLLALNASIESVRAGEHGRGFAIVAEEVRALAEQSAQAVVDITSRIEMMQLETQQSEDVAADEHQQIKDVIQSVSGSLDSLQDVIESVQQSAAGISSIADSNNKQLAITQDLVAAIEQGTESSQKNRNRAEGANWTVKTLGEVSSKMDESLNVFRRNGISGAKGQYPTGSQQGNTESVELAEAN